MYPTAIVIAVLATCLSRSGYVFMERFVFIWPNITATCILFLFLFLRCMYTYYVHIKHVIAKDHP